MMTMTGIRAGGLACACVLVLLAGCGDDGAARPDGGMSDGGGDGGAPDPTRVTIDDGTLQGAIDGDAVRFLGIPYAEPPVGDLRWKAPVPAEPWDGVRDATEFGGRCAQPASLQAEASDNEDCLYLNVWAPRDPPDEPMPVMFWIHGGGNESGSASDPVPLGVGGLFYDGRPLVEGHDVVVVTFNYRLGALGFFSLPELGDEGSPAGNQGLLDQQLALEWVQANIAAFGGDPDNVTIFGESAGSFDVCFHVASPGSRGLFHRAISESGGCTTYLPTAAQAATGTEAFVQAVGCDTATDVLSCLRGKTAGSLIIPAPLDGGTDGLPGGERYSGGTPRWRFGAVVDGEVLPDQPRTLFDAGDVAQVPYILGSNSDEGTLFHIGVDPVTTEAEYTAALERAYGTTRAAEIAAAYPVADFDSPEAALERVTGDSGLVCGTYDTALRAAAAGLTTRMYNFDVPIPLPGLGFLGATHGAEIAFVFGSVSDAPPEDLAVGEAMRGYWTRFAATGDPNGPGAVQWPEFSATNDQRLQFNAMQIGVIDDFRATECALWRSIYDDAFP